MLETPFLKRMCQIAGVVLAITSLILTAQFGLSISYGMMFALSVVSFMASYLPAILVEMSESGRHRWLVIAGIVVTVFVTAIDVTTNASTTGVHKTSDMVQATMQQAVYEDTRGGVTDLTTKRDDLSKKAGDLDKALRTLTETTLNGWTVTVAPGQSPESFDGDIAAKQLEIEQEKKRGGCGPRCLARTQELGVLQKVRQLAADIAQNKKDYDATVNELNGRRDVAATVKQGESAVQVQNFRLASWFTGSRQPSEAAQHWTDQGLMAAIGIVITIASQFFNILGWVGDRSAKSFKDRFGINSALVPTVPVGSSVPAIRDRIVEKPVFPLREMILSHA